jgi:hypothetical protein
MQRAAAAAERFGTAARARIAGLHAHSVPDLTGVK